MTPTPEARWLLALALPVLAGLAVLHWAGWLRRHGRFDGQPGRGHGWAARIDSKRVTETAADVAALGSATLVSAATALFALAFLGHHELRAALLLAGASVLAAVAGTTLKRLTRRHRPLQAGAAYFGSSFPSTHTLMSTTLYLSAAGLLMQSGAWPAGAPLLLVAALLVALGVGASRVLLRVHYLSDVVAGWVMGAALAGTVQLLYRIQP